LPAEADVVEVQLEHLAHAAALGDDRDVARLHRHEGEVGVDGDLGIGVLDALRVRTEEAHAVAVGQLDHLALAFDALLADLLETGGVDDGELDAFLAALLDDSRHQVVPDRDVDQVDHVRHVEHRLESLERADVTALRVDREDRTLVAVGRQILDDDVADGVGVGRRTDDRDSPRFEETVKHLSPPVPARSGPHRERP
jgi:hypothetical protein